MKFWLKILRIKLFCKCHQKNSSKLAKWANFYGTFFGTEEVNASSDSKKVAFLFFLLLRACQIGKKHKHSKVIGKNWI